METKRQGRFVLLRPTSRTSIRNLRTDSEGSWKEQEYARPKPLLAVSQWFCFVVLFLAGATTGPISK